MAQTEKEEIEAIIRYIKEKITIIEAIISDPYLRLAKMQEWLKNPLSGLNRTEANSIIKKFFSGHISHNEQLTGGRRRNSLGEVVQSNNINQRNMSTGSYTGISKDNWESSGKDGIELDLLSASASIVTSPRGEGKGSYGRDSRDARDSYGRDSRDARDAREGRDMDRGKNSSRRSSHTSLPPSLNTPPKAPPSKNIYC